jgi:hypothetical protein
MGGFLSLPGVVNRPWCVEKKASGGQIVVEQAAILVAVTSEVMLFAQVDEHLLGVSQAIAVALDGGMLGSGFLVNMSTLRLACPRAAQASGNCARPGQDPRKSTFRGVSWT